MRKAIIGLIGAGALLLLVAQFLPLYETHVTSMAASVGSGSVGSDHGWGVLPLAILAGLLALPVWSSGSRFALLLVALLGVAALAIGLGHDLSDSRAHGLRLVKGHYEMATNVIAIGLYTEIAGALLLLVAAIVGFLLGDLPVAQKKPAMTVAERNRRRNRELKHRPGEPGRQVR